MSQSTFQPGSVVEIVGNTTQHGWKIGDQVLIKYAALQGLPQDGDTNDGYVYTGVKVVDDVEDPAPWSFVSSEAKSV